MTPDQLAEIRARLNEANRSTQYERELFAPTWDDVAALLAEVDRLKALVATIEDQVRTVREHGV
jgi:hypothetical protein